MTIAASAVAHILEDRTVSANAEAIWCARRVGHGRLVLDLDRLLDRSSPLDPAEPWSATWSAIRRRIAVLPGARERADETAAGIVRRGLEDHALAIRGRGAIGEIIDRRLVADLEALDPLNADESSLDPVVIESHWGRTRGSGGGRTWTWRRRLVAASIGGGIAAVVGGLVLKTESAVSTAGLAAAASLPLLGRRLGTHAVPANPGPDPHGSEAIRVGAGWVETGSGRRRHRDDVVTTVLRERDDVDRIEVRLVGVERVVRLRFESVHDPAFRAFWSRWAA